MKFLQRYFKSIGIKRPLIMLLGNFIMGCAVSLLRLSTLGNDAYNAMTMALSEVIGMQFGVFNMLAGSSLLIVQILFGREYIGIGTIVNAMIVGYFVDFFNWLWKTFQIGPNGMVSCVIVMLLGLVICSLGLSLYQGAATGMSPYDSLPFMVRKKFPKFPYFWARMMFDLTSVLICIAAGGIQKGRLGVGTVCCAFGLGPVIALCDKYITKRWIFTERKEDR